MKIVSMLLYCFLFNVVFAQKDVSWKVSDNVYIKAPSNANKIAHFSKVYGSGGTRIFSANNIQWENDTHKFKVDASYDINTLRLMKYSSDLEKIAWLEDGLKCEIMSTELKRHHLGIIGLQSDYSCISVDSDYKLTLPEKIKGKYYYFDYNKYYYVDKDNERVFLTLGKHISLWGKIRPRYRRKIRCEIKFTRRLLIDSVLYTFTMTTKKDTKRRKKWKDIEEHKSFFHNFINSILIKEEDESTQK